MKVKQIMKHEMGLYKNKGYLVLSCTRPGILGNPFTEKKYGLDKCLELYEEYFVDSVVVQDWLCKVHNRAQAEDKGIALACFCKNKNKCHTLTLKNHLHNLDIID